MTYFPCYNEHCKFYKKWEFLPCGFLSGITVDMVIICLTCELCKAENHFVQK
jgi:hypothetical protein